MAQSWKDLLSTFDVKKPSSQPREESVSEIIDTFDNKVEEEAGVIFTDSSILAKKFCINRQEILDVINGFISSEKACGRKWLLLDTSYAFSDRHSFRKNGWEDYARRLNEFIRENGIPEDIHTPVFIIGGNDVVPIPKKRMRVVGVPIGYDVEQDFLYCFKPEVEVTELLNSVKTYGEQASDLIYMQMQCNISRLPTETGFMSLSFQDTVGYYLDRCKELNANLQINKSIGLSTLSWLHCSKYIMKGIPSVVPNIEEGIVKGHMYVSPNFHIDNPDGLMASMFLQNSLLADMCLFNLHGDILSHNCNYYGEPGMDNAFSPEMAAKIHVDLICSLACYGARHTGYTARSSIMMSALYNNVMLFMGSCQPAYLCTDRFSYSDLFAKLFMYNLAKGVPAGEALLRAKITYLQRFGLIDGFSLAYLTISEFNLFGNPRFVVLSDTIDPTELSLDLDSLDYPESDDEELLEFTDTDIPSLDDAFIAAQEAVDSALLDIETRLKDELSTEYSLENLKMFRAVNVEGKNNIGYKFIFTFRQDNSGIAMVKTDKEGRITSITRTK